MPIVISSIGVVIGLVAIPLVMFAPGDYEIETLVMSHNSNVDEESEKLVLM